jgi:hypothetical protein
VEAHFVGAYTHSFGQLLTWAGPTLCVEWFQCKFDLMHIPHIHESRPMLALLAVVDLGRPNPVCWMISMQIWSDAYSSYSWVQAYACIIGSICILFQHLSHSLGSWCLPARHEGRKQACKCWWRQHHVHCIFVNGVEKIARYLKDQGIERRWKYKFFGPPAIPRQHDTSSCGMFICAYAGLLSAGVPLKDSFCEADLRGLGQAVEVLVRAAAPSTWLALAALPCLPVVCSQGAVMWEEHNVKIISCH